MWECCLPKPGTVGGWEEGPLYFSRVAVFSSLLLTLIPCAFLGCTEGGVLKLPQVQGLGLWLAFSQSAWWGTLYMLLHFYPRHLCQSIWSSFKITATIGDNKHGEWIWKVDSHKVRSSLWLLVTQIVTRENWHHHDSCLHSRSPLLCLLLYMKLPCVICTSWGSLVNS